MEVGDHPACPSRKGAPPAAARWSCPVMGGMRSLNCPAKFHLGHGVDSVQLLPGGRLHRVANETTKGPAGGLTEPEGVGGNQIEVSPRPALGSHGIPDQDPRATEEGVGHERRPPSWADLLLKGVYGDYPRDGDGCLLARGIQGDRVWQGYWRRLASLSFPRNSVPQGKQGNTFLLQLALELDGVREGKWNSEKPLVFAAVVLQRSQGVT